MIYFTSVQWSNMLHVSLKNHHRDIILKMTDEDMLHELDVACVNHCLSFEQVADEWIETYSIKEVKSEIMAFLNSDGGIIYVGVEDDGSIIGFNDIYSKDQIDLKLRNWIQEAFFPKPSGLIHYYFNMDNVLIIEVSKGMNKPYYLREKGPKPSGVYVRVGRSKRKANDDEILHMIMESHSYSYEDDISENQDLTFKAFKRILEDNDMNLTPRLINTLGFKKNW